MKLVLSAFSEERQRRQALQRFMLLCDSVTIATEIPIALDSADFDALASAGVSIPPELARLRVAHVDLIQIRSGMVHILAYKADSHARDPIEELTLWAIALSRATGLRLYDFKCAWFNEDKVSRVFPALRPAQAGTASCWLCWFRRSCLGWRSASPGSPTPPAATPFRTACHSLRQRPQAQVL